MMNYFTLMSYVLTYAPKGPIEESDRAWMRALSEVLDEVTPVHVQILSTLTLLSNALMSGQSLPPLVALPQPYEMTRHLLSLPPEKPGSVDSHSTGSGSTSSLASTASSQPPARPESSSVAKPADDKTDQKLGAISEPEPWQLLDARNMEQKGYTEFAVLQVASTLILSELQGLVATIKELVGTVDFTFRIQHNDGSDTSLERLMTIGTWASRAEAYRYSARNARSTGAAGKGKND